MNSYRDCELHMAKARNWGYRPLPGRATSLQALDGRNGPTFVIRYHSTDVVAFHRDGRVVLNSGGWLTPTTKDRINEYMPPGYVLFQEKSVWYLRVMPWDSGQVFAFEDGLTIMPDGSVLGAGSALRAKQEARVMSRQINRYIRDYLRALTSGQAAHDWEVDDLANLILTDYYPVGLLLMACDSAEYTAPAMSWAIQNAVSGQLHDWDVSFLNWQGRNTLRMFLRRRLGLPSSGWA